MIYFNIKYNLMCIIISMVIINTMKHISIQFNLNINNHTNSFSIVGVLIVDFSLQLLLVN